MPPSDGCNLVLGAGLRVPQTRYTMADTEPVGDLWTLDGFCRTLVISLDLSIKVITSQVLKSLSVILMCVIDMIIYMLAKFSSKEFSCVPRSSFSITMSEGNRYNINMEQTASIYLDSQPLITEVHSLTHVPF